MDTKFKVHDMLVKVYSPETSNKDRQEIENQLQELGKKLRLWNFVWLLITWDYCFAFNTQWSFSDCLRLNLGENVIQHVSDICEIISTQ